MGASGGMDQAPEHPKLRCGFRHQPSELSAWKTSLNETKRRHSPRTLALLIRTRTLRGKHRALHMSWLHERAAPSCTTPHRCRQKSSRTLCTSAGCGTAWRISSVAMSRCFRCGAKWDLLLLLLLLLRLRLRLRTACHTMTHQNPSPHQPHRHPPHPIPSLLHLRPPLCCRVHQPFLLLRLLLLQHRRL